MRNSPLLSFVLGFVATLLTNLISAQYLEGCQYICRKESIECCQQNKTTAEKFIGKIATRDINKIKLYIDVLKEGSTYYLYVHSNFISDGFTLPTKILYNISDAGLELDRWLLNIVGYEVNAAPVTIYVNNKVFRTNATVDFDFKNAENIYVLNRNQNVIDEGYDIVRKQKFLRENRYYSSTIDGIDGDGTQNALDMFESDFQIHTYENKTWYFDESNPYVEFEDGDDFLQYFDSIEDLCSSELCVGQSEASFSVGCGLVSINASSNGNLNMSLGMDGASYDFNIVQGKEIHSGDGCNLSRSVCINKSGEAYEISRSFDFTCDDQTVSFNSNGSFKISGSNYSIGF